MKAELANIAMVLVWAVCLAAAGERHRNLTKLINDHNHSGRKCKPELGPQSTSG